MCKDQVEDISRFFLDRDDCLLLVVDVQDRLLSAIPDCDELVQRCAIMVEGCQALSVPILLTQQYSRGLGPTASALREMIQDGHVEKLHFDCCREPGFLPELEGSGRKTVLLCGLETHICILQTCLGLRNRGYKVHVLADAVSSRDPRKRQLALELMRDAGAVISNTETALFQMLGKAEGGEFKRISALVK
ncbi:MAG: hydrolase [Candidatus Methanomethylophilaceae archaeon]|nr:hydrolase [Candidatus Methanomethylophilaceae archaeon]